MCSNTCQLTEILQVIKNKNNYRTIVMTLLFYIKCITYVHVNVVFMYMYMSIYSFSLLKVPCFQYSITKDGNIYARTFL
jgi:hypothetical protein